MNECIMSLLCKTLWLKCGIRVAFAGVQWKVATRAAHSWCSWSCSSRSVGKSFPCHEDQVGLLSCHDTTDENITAGLQRNSGHMSFCSPAFPSHQHSTYQTRM